MCGGLKNTFFVTLLGASGRRGSEKASVGSGSSHLALPRQADYSKWLRGSDVSFGASRDPQKAHVREASCCGWRQRPLWALLQGVRCWGLLSGLLSPAGLPTMATGRRAWARTKEEPATSPLSSGPKLRPCKADRLFLVPAQTL